MKSPQSFVHHLFVAASFALALGFSVERADAKSYTVNNLNDSGPGSLRAAIQKANNNPGADVINFSHELSGTIFLASRGIDREWQQS